MLGLAESDSSNASNGNGRVWAFLSGLLAGAAGAVIANALSGTRRALDPRLIRDSREDPDIPPAVVIPGILGSELIRADGTHAWLNARNAFGYFDLTLPLELPLQTDPYGLKPGGLIGVDGMLPRLFGFTEYADLLELLDVAGFHRDTRPNGSRGAVHHVFTYDWRRDLAESARALDETLRALAEARGEPAARFNLIAHSMGGLVARYYLRYGTAPLRAGAPVTWAGARRIQNLVLVATPNSGSIPALDAILNGSRIGLSTTTLAASVIARMPAIYQLLPPAGTVPLLDAKGDPIMAELHDSATWERFGWGPFAPMGLRAAPSGSGNGVDPEGERAFLAAVLERARTFHGALYKAPETPCPVRVIALGGDCLPTLARVIVPEERGRTPRLEAASAAEMDQMFEAGDGRVTRGSVLASHLPDADTSESGCGLPEVTQTFFGHADHHGIYREPTFQSILLRLLLRPVRRGESAGAPAPRRAEFGARV
jgi:pimeloyl-ACP methyl ester carboxylesterase